ncbi:hypothetical protein ACFY3E_27545 [Streptomyces griseorubiginosus]
MSSQSPQVLREQGHRVGGPKGLRHDDDLAFEEVVAEQDTRL